MRRWFRSSVLLMIILAVGISATTAIRADEVLPPNPLEWMDKLETDILGHVASGSLLERLARFEELMVGRVRGESIVHRLAYLDTLLYTNQPYDISLNYKIQALEWLVFRRIYPELLAVRVERLEKALFGTAYNGPLAGRMEKMVTQVFPGGAVRGHWVSVLEGTQVKVKILDNISSGNSKSGDRFRFEVTETVYSQNMVIIPRGAVGYGEISRVTPPRRLGIDARLMLDFKEIRAMDATPVALYYGVKSSELNRPRQLAVGASTAGMLILGPQGILIGMAIKGKEKSIPAETELYVQVKKPVRIHTLQK